jgi:hypothetical protein
MLKPGHDASIVWRKFKVPIFLLFVIAIQLPFLDQAFHMDDGLFLRVAKNISRNPFFPQDTGILFEGKWAHDLASMEHPPITAYALAAGASLLGGFSERNLHGTFLLFSLILAMSMYSLASKFSRHPVVATMLLLVLPSVAISSHTLMADLPHLAMWTASVAAFVRGVDRNRKGFIVLSSVLVACSAFASLAGFCLIPLLVYYAYLSRQPFAGWLIVIIPMLLTGSWLCVNYLHFHRFTPGFVFEYYLQTERVYRPTALLQKYAYLSAALGGIMVFPLILVLPAVIRWRMRLGIGVISAFLLLEFTDAGSYAFVPQLLFFVFTFIGSTVAAGFLIDAIQSILELRRTRRVSARGFLGIWFCGVFLFCIIFYMTGSGRYLLPLTPPLVLAFVREMEAVCSKRLRPIVLTVSIAATAGLALALSIADYQFSKIYRDFGKVADTQKRVNSRLWFTGEWGLRVYLEKIGGQELGRRDARPQPGDLVVIPQLATPYTTLLNESTNLDSIIMIAPSRVRFAVPSLNRKSTLILFMGLPFWEKSDGLNLDVTLESGNKRQVLVSKRIHSQSGRTWTEVGIPLGDFAGKAGLVTFEVSVGEGGDATADWLAIAKARIEEPDVYDFREKLSTARIDSIEGSNYQTAQNRPVFPMEVTLAQPPALRPIARWEYGSALPLRLLDNSTHAGFWSMGWGFLPFAFVRPGVSVIETLTIYEVIRKIDPYGSSQLSWYPE